MDEAARGILEVLKRELGFIESGGYDDLELASGKRSLVFRDAPSCVHYTEAVRNLRCNGCPLMEFVPPADRGRELPCHAMPIGPDGETVEQVGAHGDRQHLAQAVAEWLKATIRRIEQAERLASTRKPSRPAERRSRPQVLIVDQDGGIRILLDHLLAEDGCDTTLASDGHTALRNLARHSFDLILLNDYLPDISTEVVLQHAGGSDQCGPLLLLQSGPLPDELAMKYARMGVRFFVGKYSPKEIAELVAYCLERSKLAEVESRKSQATTTE